MILWNYFYSRNFIEYLILPLTLVLIWFSFQVVFLTECSRFDLAGWGFINDSVLIFESMECNTVFWSEFLELKSYENEKYK